VKIYLVQFRHCTFEKWILY